MYVRPAGLVEETGDRGPDQDEERAEREAAAVGRDRVAYSSALQRRASTRGPPFPVT